MKKTAIPSILWHSDPVRPDETVVISGENFTQKSVVELAIDDNWITLEPIQSTSQSLKVIIPADWSYGIYKCRVRNGKDLSGIVHINAPDAWWSQGDEGVNSGCPGGWVRIFGKCLKGSGLKLGKTDLKITFDSDYALSADLPKGLQPGTFELFVSDSSLGEFEILPPKEEGLREVNVLDYGADPTGMEDSTSAVIYATTQFLGQNTKGILYFPRGRYRIDSTLRVDGRIEAPLNIPAGVVFRGDGADLTTLWWPDHEKPLPSLIAGGNDFGIEDLAIYTQGNHGTLIAGDSNVRINNVRIRANYCYMTTKDYAHHGRAIPAGTPWLHAAFLLTGVNNQVTNCDVYTSGLCFLIYGGAGSVFAHNKIMANRMVSMLDCRKVVFEHNSFTGNQLNSTGNDIYMTFAAKNVYYAHNHTAHLYGGDHETITLDGHANAYLGTVEKLDDTRWRMKKPVFSGKAKGAVFELCGLTAFIIDGYGRGQYRHLAAVKGSEFTIERPWTVEPDASSVISIGGFSGRHLFIGNTAQDSGSAIQLYPPNFECIVAENKSIRASNINSLSILDFTKGVDFVRVEPSWYNQFLDNHVVVGNGWGGGDAEIDAWLGGKSTLNIRALQRYCFDTGNREYMCPWVLRKILGESSSRDKSIALSLCQIVRRHKADNNSSIRIQGAVSDVLVEGAHIARSDKGIQVDHIVDYKRPEGSSQLVDFHPEPGKDAAVVSFLCPDAVIIRNSTFDDVDTPYSGTALEQCVIVKGSNPA
jgi:hypothetical protein